MTLSILSDRKDTIVYPALPCLQVQKLVQRVQQLEERTASGSMQDTSGLAQAEPPASKVKITLQGRHYVHLPTLLLNSPPATNLVILWIQRVLQFELAMEANYMQARGLS